MDTLNTKPLLRTSVSKLLIFESEYRTLLSDQGNSARNYNQKVLPPHEAQSILLKRNYIEISDYYQ